MKNHRKLPMMQPVERVAGSMSALQGWVRHAELVGCGIVPAASGDGETQREQAKMLKRIRELEMENEILRRGTGVSVASEPSDRVRLPKITFPLVRELAAAGARSGVSGVVACRVLGFPKQAYYQLVRALVSDRDWGEAHLINAARDVWDEDRCQGYRLICDELVDDGWQVPERRVWRVCSQQGMFSVAHRRKARRKNSLRPPG